MTSATPGMWEPHQDAPDRPARMEPRRDVLPGVDTVSHVLAPDQGSTVRYRADSTRKSRVSHKTSGDQADYAARFTSAHPSVVFRVQNRIGGRHFRHLDR